MTTMPELIEPTPEMLKKWGDTRTALMWHAPAFSHLFYTMLNKNGAEHIAYFVPDYPADHPEHIPWAATDGAHILINPEPFFKLNLFERVFATSHEVIHGMCGHVELMQRCAMAGCVAYPDGKKLPYDAQTMNKAMDYVVNDMLIQSKIGQYNEQWLWDTTIGTYEDDVLTVYRRILPQDQGGQGKQSSKQGQKQVDKHLKPGTTTGKDAASATAQRNEQEWKTAIAGAMASAKAQGKLPAALERVMGEELEPEVDWTDQVKSFFARKVGGGSYDWRKPDRRLIVRNIIGPARTGFGCGDIVVGVDTSGSVYGGNILERFLAEIGGILEDIRPRRLFIMWCDADIGRVDELNDGSDLYEVRRAKAPGGGGTAFEPVFDKIKELDIQPDALIYLTDGYGSFPSEPPPYQVMWGNITPGYKYPFGDVIDVPV